MTIPAPERVLRPGCVGNAEQIAAVASRAVGATSTGAERTRRVREHRSASGNARIGRHSRQDAGAEGSYPRIQVREC